jgi:CBS domain-containing protein
MQNVPTRLKEIADQVKKRETPQEETVRTILLWFGASRRGLYIVRDIRKTLKKLGLQTVPDFEVAYIDSPVKFVSASPTDTNDKTPQIGAMSTIVTGLMETKNTDPLIGLTTDPTYRIGKLASANKTPVWVKPSSSLKEAITLMLSHDFSQLPIMETERDVKGVISWVSIGSRLALGRTCELVSDCMERYHEISAETSLFSAIDTIVKYEYVLIRDATKKISGIVTTSDLSLQFRQLGEPFLVLGEIENHIRRLIRDKFTVIELSAVRDPEDNERQIADVSDLMFGEYIRLLENPDRWSNLKLAIDRKVFIEHLEPIRKIIEKGDET